MDADDDLGPRAARAEAALQEFVSIIAHDLSEPVRGLVGFAEILSLEHADQLGEEGAQVLAGIDRQGRRLQTLLSAVVAWGRLGRGGLEIAPCDLSDVVSSIDVPLVAERGAEVTVTTGKVTADPALLAQVLGHLLDNAVRFNESAPPIVEIAPLTDGNGISVSDNGLGIEPQRRDQALKIFGRLHGRDEFGGGVGAGLAMVTRIATLHGGSVELADSPLGGTAVAVRFGS